MYVESVEGLTCVGVPCALERMLAPRSRRANLFSREAGFPQKIPDRIAHGLQTVIWIHLVSIPTAGPRWIAAATTIARHARLLQQQHERHLPLCGEPLARRGGGPRLVRETMDDEFALFAAEIGQLEAAAKEKDAGDASPAEAPPPVPPLPRPRARPPDRARPRADERLPGDDRQGAGGETSKWPRNAPRPGAAAVASIPRPAASALGVPPQAPDPRWPQPPPRRVHRRRSPRPPRTSPHLPAAPRAPPASVKKVGAPVYRSPPAATDGWTSPGGLAETTIASSSAISPRGDGRASRARVRKVPLLRHGPRGDGQTHE